MEKLSVIVPCFNEQETLQDYYDAISKVRETLLGKECELQVILVDDGSKDGTLEKMKELSGQCSWIRYISFTRNFGKCIIDGCGSAGSAGADPGDVRHHPSGRV